MHGHLHLEITSSRQTDVEPIKSFFAVFLVWEKSREKGSVTLLYRL